MFLTARVGLAVQVDLSGFAALVDLGGLVACLMACLVRRFNRFHSDRGDDGFPRTRQTLAVISFVEVVRSLLNLDALSHFSSREMRDIRERAGTGEVDVVIGIDDMLCDGRSRFSLTHVIGVFLDPSRNLATCLTNVGLVAVTAWNFVYASAFKVYLVLAAAKKTTNLSISVEDGFNVDFCQKLANAVSSSSHVWKVGMSQWCIVVGIVVIITVASGFSLPSSVELLVGEAVEKKSLTEFARLRVDVFGVRDSLRAGGESVRH